jgi:hypothetical protein
MDSEIRPGTIPVLHHVNRNGKFRLSYSVAFLVVLAAFVGAVLAGCGGGGGKSSGGSNAPAAGSSSGTSTGKSGGGGASWG